jgi:hypothetical protein
MLERLVPALANHGSISFSVGIANFPVAVAAAFVDHYASEQSHAGLASRLATDDRGCMCASASFRTRTYLSCGSFRSDFLPVSNYK